MKIELRHGTGLILFDFTETLNVSSMMRYRDFTAIYFTSRNCVLQINGEICHKSFCILSNDELHDVNMVHEIQRLVIENLNAELTLILTLNIPIPDKVKKLS